MKKKFKIEEVLSSIQGILICPIGNVYEVLNFLTGDNIYTHQLPRVGKQCQSYVYKQHPFLKEINLDGVNPDNWKERLSEIKNKYPNEIELIQIGDFNHVDPVSEAVKMMGGDESKVIVI